MRKRTRIAAFAGLEIAAKPRIGFEPIDIELDRRQRPEGKLGVCQHNFDHALDEIGLDGGVGTTLNPDRALSATAAKQYVDDRIDQAGIDRRKSEIVPLFGLEDGQNCRQRN